MTVFLDNFHFIRSYWLLALIPIGIIWLVLRRSQDPARQFGGLIEPHLLRHLLHQPGQGKIFRPVHLLLVLWLLLVVSVAGPSWRIEPSPFAEDKAGLMILMKLGPSMKGQDLRPSRLERAQHKLHDLFELRGGGSVGLIAYSGSSHLVMPLTQDTRIIEQMAGALDPSLMPVAGDALVDALTLAAEQFMRRKSAGSILVITDSVDPGSMPALAEYTKRGVPPVQFLAAVSTRDLVVQNGIEKAGDALGAPFAVMTVDDSDVRQVINRAESQVAAAIPERDEVQWQDDGYLLVPLILLGLLLWSRRGWNVRWDY